MPAPELEARRTKLGRLKMLMVLAVCAAPVVASYFTYFVVRPHSTTNYGTLIRPTRSLPELGLRQLDGRPVSSVSLKGQWLMVLVGPASCGETCERRLLLQRQLREMVGRDRDRIDKLWLLTDAGQPTPTLLAATQAAPAVHLLRADAQALGRWLEPAGGHGLEEHLYIVDPMGEWMMRMPAQADPSRVKRDLERLLRASAGWDKAGR